MRIGIPTEKIHCAEFELWMPPRLVDNVAKARAVVTLAPGSNGDGRGWVDSKTWREFCEKNDTALLGCFFKDKDPSAIEGYCKAGEESGSALLWALREYSERLKHSELDRVPLLMYGFSAGGQFNYEMNNAFPRRVGAFVVNKGGIYYTALAQELARQNPGLFFTGTKDSMWRQDIVRGLVAVNRVGGAKWRLVQEHVAHDEGNSEKVSQGFFELVLKNYEE